MEKKKKKKLTCLEKKEGERTAMWRGSVSVKGRRGDYSGGSARPAYKLPAVPNVTVYNYMLVVVLQHS